MNKDRIKSLVNEEREKLISGEVSDLVAVLMEHIGNNEKLIVSLRSLYSNTDSLITVTDFRPVVKSIHDVDRPLGYLIPKNITELYDWAERQNLVNSDFDITQDQVIQEYFVSKIDSIDFEGDTVVNPEVELIVFRKKIDEQDYYFIPTKQLKNNLVVIALEPKSMLGLVTYKEFEHLLKAGEYYPILRVVEK